MDANGLKISKENQGKYEPHSWLPLHDYQRNRIVGFGWPDKIDQAGVGWNQRQSKISVGSHSVAQALGMSTTPLIWPCTGAVPRIE